MRSSVLRKRGSVAGSSPSSGSSSAVASRSRLPKAEVKALALLAPGAVEDFLRACSWRARSSRAPRSASPTRRAMRARRSQPAQEIAAENVCRCRLPAKFPRPRVGLLERRDGALAEPVQPLEQRLVAGAHQALVEEQLRGREDHRAIDVVLHLLGGQVAEAHRTHAAITGQRRWRSSPRRADRR